MKLPEFALPHRQASLPAGLRETLPADHSGYFEQRNEKIFPNLLD